MRNSVTRIENLQEALGQLAGVARLWAEEGVSSTSGGSQTLPMQPESSRRAEEWRSRLPAGFEEWCRMNELARGAPAWVQGLVAEDEIPEVALEEGKGKGRAIDNN